MWPFKKKKKRKVLVHCEGIDIILPVYRGDIIRVPWGSSYCPFRLEPDGTVTLRLMWGDTPASGFGKTWNSITWEKIE